ncbi:hypothetical protein X801_05635 [Opisthorchis viverrini]|uniref:Uncharacterized protein n=1 Tax=Opisthorchis viverrini TaxID=6198 RepID=A0A1S8WVU9_OPIVI|nr:hypothetical protein X801_05635 [Opisthorchis viverrini]
MLLRIKLQGQKFRNTSFMQLLPPNAFNRRIKLNYRPTVGGKRQQAPFRLRTYTGEEVNLLRTKNVYVSYECVTMNETIYIAEGSGPNLFGLD